LFVCFASFHFFFFFFFFSKAFKKSKCARFSFLFSFLFLFSLFLCCRVPWFLHFFPFFSALFVQPVQLCTISPTLYLFHPRGTFS